VTYMMTHRTQKMIDNDEVHCRICGNKTKEGKGFETDICGECLTGAK